METSSHRQRHRGAHPEDARLFGERQVPRLRAATADLSWLLSRGYAMPSSLKLVGDRHTLHERQRLAVSRAACTDASLTRRKQTRCDLSELSGQNVTIDGFNLIIMLEAALSGGVLLRGRDGCLRDLSSVHGSYRSVEETDGALALIGDFLADFSPASVTWFLDRPVSNSGRLAEALRALAEQHKWPWEVEAVFSPDKRLLTSPDVAVTTDAVILDGVSRWTDLGTRLIEERVSDAWRIDLRTSQNSEAAVGGEVRAGDEPGER